MRRDGDPRIPYWLMPAAALVLDLLVVVFVLPPRPVRDELVFYPAALAFRAAGWLPPLEFLRHYPAPQTPFSFYVAGRILAFVPSLPLLRLFDTGLVFAALWRFSRFAWQHCGKHAVLASALLVLNPYVHLAATHFYTDALYFYLVIAALTVAPRSRRSIVLALLPLTRQFGVIFPAADALSAARQRRGLAALLALLALAPLLGLVALWRGLAPDTPRSETLRAVHAVYGWIFPYVTAYHVAALGFYAAPLAYFVARSRWILCGAVVGVLLSLLAPAHANFSAQLAGSAITTLGLFQRLTLVFGTATSRLLIVCFGGLGGALLAHAFAHSSARRVLIALALLLGAFNAQAWDKYLLDVLPALLLAILEESPGAPTDEPLPSPAPR